MSDNCGKNTDTHMLMQYLLLRNGLIPSDLVEYFVATLKLGNCILTCMSLQYV
jgi:hypothetical protein